MKSITKELTLYFTTHLVHLVHSLVNAFHEVRAKCKQEGGEICVSVSLCSFIGACNANAIMQTVIYYYMQTLETHILGHC